jgi:hypothetical protein
MARALTLRPPLHAPPGCTWSRIIALAPTAQALLLSASTAASSNVSTSKTVAPGLAWVRMPTVTYEDGSSLSFEKRRTSAVSGRGANVSEPIRVTDVFAHPARHAIPMQRTTITLSVVLIGRFILLSWCIWRTEGHHRWCVFCQCTSSELWACSGSSANPPCLVFQMP